MNVEPEPKRFHRIVICPLAGEPLTIQHCTAAEAKNLLVAFKDQSDFLEVSWDEGNDVISGMDSAPDKARVVFNKANIMCIYLEEEAD